MNRTASELGSPAPKGHSVADLAQRLGGELRGDGHATIRGVNSLDQAKPDEITFISSGAYANDWSKSNAGTAVVNKGLSPIDKDGAPRPLILVPSAEIAMIALLELFATPEPVPEVGVHPTAFVHASAKLGKQVRIGPHVSVGAYASIDDNVVLHAGVRIYDNVGVGAGTVIHANTVIRHHCKIGRGVILHQNVSIGADGFGYRPDPRGGGLLKVPHLGNVVLEDGVEIGANSCVDRGKFGSTVVGSGTKIDNLVQVGHNCKIGHCCVIAGCVGISGSVTIGDGVQIGGAAGIIDNLKVGDGARLGGMAFVTRDVPAGVTFLGHPADEAQSALRQWASVRKLPELIRRLSKGQESGEQQLRRHV